MPSKSMSPQMRSMMLVALILGLAAFLGALGLAAYLAPELKTVLAARQEKPEPEYIYVPVEPDKPDEPELDPETKAIVENLRSNARPLAAIDFPEGDYTFVQGRDYMQLWSLIAEYWSARNTDGQIREAIDKVYAAKQFYPELTMHYAMQCFIERIPQGKVKKIGGTEHIERKEAKSILIVADEIYAYLEQTYYAPAIAAQEAEQARLNAIAENQANARAKGMSNNRAKYDEAQAANAQQEQWRENGAKWSAEQKQKQRARGWIK